MVRTKWNGRFSFNFRVILLTPGKRNVGDDTSVRGKSSHFFLCYHIKPVLNEFLINSSPNIYFLHRITTEKRRRHERKADEIDGFILLMAHLTELFGSHLLDFCRFYIFYHGRRLESGEQSR